MGLPAPSQHTAVHKELWLIPYTGLGTARAAQSDWKRASTLFPVESHGGPIRPQASPPEGHRRVSCESPFQHPHFAHILPPSHPLFCCLHSMLDTPRARGKVQNVFRARKLISKENQVLTDTWWIYCSKVNTGFLNQIILNYSSSLWTDIELGLWALYLFKKN